MTPISAFLAECERQGLLLQKNEISLGNILGQGTFGATYTAEYRGQKVAVKKISVTKDRTSSALFIREAQALRELNSPYIVKLHGIVVESDEICWLVLDFLSGGTLKAWLYGDGRNWLHPKHSLQTKIRMCLHIAEGMQVLESLSPPLMHRDLKPTNILLDGDGQPKLSDFGLSRHCTPTSYDNPLTGETGSYLYMSPEMLRSESYGPKTDVFSFAIVMAEIFSGKEPFKDLSLTPVQIAKFVADEGGRPSLPHISSHHHFPGQIKDLIEDCWSQNPDSRPSFASIASRLRSQLQ